MEADSDPALFAKLERINAYARDIPGELERSLLHAYVACLSLDELMKTAVLSLDGAPHVLSAVRSRLVRLGREGRALSEIDALSNELMREIQPDPKARVRVEALLSHIYSFLAPPTRQAVLERWRDRGTRGAGGRWLKAIADDQFLFSVDAVLHYWRETRDPNAAKVLVKRVDPEKLTDLLPELVENSEAGWIVSRAALGARSIPDDIWLTIRAKFPATFAYLCAKKNRKLTEQEAFEVINDSMGGDFGDRGLAIWAIGQLNMPSVLDRVWDNRDRFQARDLERLGIATGHKQA